MGLRLHMNDIVQDCNVPSELTVEAIHIVSLQELFFLMIF